MIQEIKEKWVNALLSGEYKQGKDGLRDGDFYCCLGVLCEIAKAEGIVDEKGGTYFDPKNSNDQSGSTLPRAVIKWSGLPDENPYIYNTTIAEANDNGATFEEIAAEIEARF